MSDILPEPDDFGPPRASDSLKPRLITEWYDAGHGVMPHQREAGWYDEPGRLFDALGAEAAEAFHGNPLTGIFRETNRARAAGDLNAVGQNGEVDVFGGTSVEDQQRVFDAQRNAIPDASIEDAKKQVKDEGLEGTLKLPDQPSIKQPVLDMMIKDAHERRDREVAIARGPHGFFPGALGLVTSLGVGMIDPINAIAFATPVAGEARFVGLVRRGGAR